MINVVVLGFDQALASAITGVVDLFAMTGVTWNRIQGERTEPVFKTLIASKNQQDIQCSNGLKIAAHLSFDAININDVEQAQIIIVPTIGGPINQVLALNPELISLLQKANKAGWTIAGNCTGNFLLAQAGILDGKSATTHWGYKNEFEQRFPNVVLKTDQMITRDENIYCAGGGLAWFDLGLHIIERSVGFETAIHTAKAFVLDYRRDSQLSYSIMRLAKPHKDDMVSQAQAYLEKNYAQPFNVESFAESFCISKRTLIRRFNNALAMPPNTYLQSIRIERAQKMLEESRHNVEQVMTLVGYEDASSFRRLFRKKTGLSPTEYRSRFSRRIY